ncbi:MAG: ribose-phosphate diphosphokinase, partial [Candidatus Woesearchaeota archaeon]
EKSGVNRVVTFDLHVDQIQGFFNIPVDNLVAMPVLAKYIRKKNLENIVVVSPDAGGAKRARRLAKALYAGLAIIDKRRPAHGESKVMHLMGEVKGKTAILIDDIIDTAGSITVAAQELKKRGAKDIYICSTHAILSKDAIKKLQSKDIKEIIVTDSVRIPEEKRIPKIKIVHLAHFTAELINSIFEGKPMGIIVEKKIDQINNG